MKIKSLGREFFDQSVAGLSIKSMSSDDLGIAVSLLVSSFQDRPFYRYLAPDPDERRVFLVANFHQRISQGLGVNDIDLALLDGELVGIAVWSPPAIAEAGAAVHGTDSLEELLMVYSTGLRERFLAFIKILMEARDATIQQPFWSLAPIAVLPSARGKGVASVLMNRKLKDIDEARLPCFLGTQDEVNVAIYERFAFQTLRKDLVSLDLTHYTMIRQRKGL